MREVVVPVKIQNYFNYLGFNEKKPGAYLSC